MAYLVLARKWRPQSFQDVVGQEVIIKTLSRALESGRIAHAFLLTGSRGVGKTTVARLLAKALSCEQGVSSNPCSQCSHCLEIAAGESIDVIEIDGASNTGVDDIRELRENVRYQPASARYKIFIIDEVHMLSTNAFNALLKTLEEPPPHVKFIFATTEAHRIPVTILSRCQRYDFRRLRISVIVERLKYILAQENLNVSDEPLFLIAENADGGMRDALSLLDQVLSFSGESTSVLEVQEILGLIDRQYLTKATDCLLEGKTKEALEVLEAAMQSGIDDRQLLEGVALELRHLCVAASIGSLEGLADLSPERASTIEAKAKAYDALDLQRLLNMALQACQHMQASEQPKMVLELAFLRMAMRPQLAQLSEVQRALERLERLDSKAVLPKVPTSLWSNFVQQVEGQMPGVAHHLEHGRYDGKGQVEFDQRVHVMRVQEALQLPAFQALCQQHLGQPLHVSLSESIHVAQETQAKRDQESLEQKARSNPAIQKALSVFGGEIKAVRQTP